jgi:hypothetical protein
MISVPRVSIRTGSEVEGNNLRVPHRKQGAQFPARPAVIKISIGLSERRFPLTPALSLGERVPRRPSPERPARLDFSQRGRWFSLSPRERAGVRGKETPKLERRL